MAFVLGAFAVGGALMFARESSGFGDTVKGAMTDEQPAKAEIVVTDLTDANEAKEIANSKIPVVIDFYATWCGPCKLLAPNIDSIAKTYKGKVKVVRCDVDQNPALVAKYGINRYPTIIMIKPGSAPATHIGYRTVPQLKALVDAMLKP